MAAGDPDGEQSSITRRRFVGGAIVTGAAAALPAAAEARARHKAQAQAQAQARKPAAPLHADVVVVGAGLAGLSAARAVRAAGHSVIVLEARNRVGGRCYSRSLGAGATDVANMGATFVGPTQTQMLGLMSELGIGKFPVYADGKLLYYQNGKATPYTGDDPARLRPGRRRRAGDQDAAGDRPDGADGPARRALQRAQRADLGLDDRRDLERAEHHQRRRAQAVRARRGGDPVDGAARRLLPVLPVLRRTRPATPRC